MKTRTETEEETFELDVWKKYGTIEKAIEDPLAMVAQMLDKDRDEFFGYYGNCEKFEIGNYGCVGGRCFVEIEFFFELEVGEEDESDSKGSSEED
jgi:hypothetical protein